MELVIKYFDSELEYQEKLIEFIQKDQLQRVLLRGKKDFYTNRDWYRFRMNHTLEEVEDDRYFIVYWTHYKKRKTEKKEKVVTEGTYYQQHKEHILNRLKEYYLKNREKMIEYTKEYRKRKRNEDKQDI